MKENVEDVASDPGEHMAGIRAGIGIMLLTASMSLLYKNRRAGELCQEIIHCQGGRTANGILPPAVVSLLNQIRKRLEDRPDQKYWEQNQIGHVVNTLHSSLLLCGTVLIDHTHTTTRILIVMFEVGIGAWESTALVQAKEDFCLTVREASVAQHLLKGWTNKEIANEMRISVQSIKDHCRGISKKMHTTTRTGIVMKIVNSGLYPASIPPSGHVRVPTIRSVPTELVGAA